VGEELRCRQLERMGGVGEELADIVTVSGALHVNILIMHGQALPS